MDDETLPVFPAGTPVDDVNVIDRGQKMVFKCAIHPDLGPFYSKDFHSSNWFGHGQPCKCGRGPHWVLAAEYAPTRRG